MHLPPSGEISRSRDQPSELRARSLTRCGLGERRGPLGDGFELAYGASAGLVIAFTAADRRGTRSRTPSVEQARVEAVLEDGNWCGCGTRSPKSGSVLTMPTSAGASR